MKYRRISKSNENLKSLMEIKKGYENRNPEMVVDVINDWLDEEPAVQLQDLLIFWKNDIKEFKEKLDEAIEEQLE